MPSVRNIEPGDANSIWQTVSGNINATGWTNATTFGADTVTTGGKLQRPGSMQSIDALLAQGVSDGSAAAGGAVGHRLRDGVTPSAQYILSTLISAQTTTGDGYMAPMQELNPMLKAIGNLGIDSTPGPTDLGNGTATVSVRWSPRAVSSKLYWLAASISTTEATDLLGQSLVAIGGDTTFPYTVQEEAQGVRAIGYGHSSDFGAGGSSIMQFRLGGTGLVNNPQDFGGTGVGGEMAASSQDARNLPYRDEWLGVNKASQITLRAGYTGVDSGTEILAAGIAIQVS